LERSGALAFAILASLIAFSFAVAYSSARVKDSSFRAGNVSGDIVLGLVLEGPDGTAYSSEMSGRSALSLAPVGGPSAPIGDPSEVKVYLVVRVSYSCSGMSDLRINVTAVHEYEHELGLDPVEEPYLAGLNASDGAHVHEARIYLGTLDYFMWLDYYANGKTSEPYSYPFRPPSLYDDFSYDGPPSGIWRYGSSGEEASEDVRVSGGKLVLGRTEPGHYSPASPQATIYESWVETAGEYDLSSLTLKMTVYFYRPVAGTPYARAYVGDPGWDNMLLWVFRDWGFDTHVQYRMVVYPHGPVTWSWSTKSYWEGEGWHTVEVYVRPEDAGQGITAPKALVTYDGGKFACDVFWKPVTSRLRISVGQHEDSYTAVYAEVDYVAIGPSPSPKLLDWRILVSVSGTGTDGREYSASKSFYASFGRGEPVLDELSIRPAGYAVCTDDALSLAIVGSVRGLLSVIGA